MQWNGICPWDSWGLVTFQPPQGAPCNTFCRALLKFCCNWASSRYLSWCQHTCTSHLIDKGGWKKMLTIICNHIRWDSLKGNKQKLVIKNLICNKTQSNETGNFQQITRMFAQSMSRFRITTRYNRSRFWKRGPRNTGHPTTIKFR